MTFDGTVFTLYWDGVERVSSTWPAVGTWPYAPNAQEPLQIGLDFKGAMQEVAVYDKVLTAAADRRALPREHEARVRPS